MSFNSGSKDENLEPLRGLEEIDVTSYAEDNKELQQKFEEKICRNFPPLSYKLNEANSIPHRLER